MNPRLPAIFITIAALFPVAQPAFSQQQLLFIADFASNALEDFVATSGWSIDTSKQSAILIGESTSTESLYLSSGADWIDYGIDMRLRLLSGSVSLHARASDDACSSYAFTIWSDLDLIALSVADADCKLETLASSSGDFTLNQWTDVGLQIQGTQLTALIDGEAVLTAESEAYAQGAPMLMLPGFAQNGATTHVEIESIVVSPLEPIVDAAQLDNYAGSYREVIAQLQERGVVPEGGASSFRKIMPT